MNSGKPHDPMTPTGGLRAGNRRLLTSTITAIFLTLAAQSAEAINKCVDGGGNVSYQETTCPEDANQQDLKLPHQASTEKAPSKTSGPAANDSSEDATILDLVSVISTYEMCAKVSPDFTEKNASIFKAWNTQNAKNLARFEKSERYKLLLENGRRQSAQQMQTPGIGNQLTKFCEVQFIPVLKSTVQQ